MYQHEKHSPAGAALRRNRRSAEVLVAFRLDSSSYLITGLYTTSSLLNTSENQY
jgi:hypothetical protein